MNPNPLTPRVAKKSSLTPTERQLLLRKTGLKINKGLGYRSVVEFLKDI